MNSLKKNRTEIVDERGSAQAQRSAPAPTSAPPLPFRSGVQAKPASPSPSVIYASKRRSVGPASLPRSRVRAGACARAPTHAVAICGGGQRQRQRHLRQRHLRQTASRCAPEDVVERRRAGLGPHAKSEAEPTCHVHVLATCIPMSAQEASSYPSSIPAWPRAPSSRSFLPGWTCPAAPRPPLVGHSKRVQAPGAAVWGGVSHLLALTLGPLMGLKAGTQIKTQPPRSCWVAEDSARA